MIESYFIYFLILLILLVGAYADKQTHHISGWISILICSFILGFRYDVGIDYLTYLYNYKQYLYLDSGLGNYSEYGFDLLNYICARLGCGPGIFFTLTVLIQFTLIYLTFRYKTGVLVLIYFFYMTTGQLFGSLNIIRQAMAFSIFLYSIKYIEQRNILKYFAGVTVAILFHTSSLILIPIYWLPQVWKCTIERISIQTQIVIYILVTLLSASLFVIFLNATTELLSSTIYFNYVPNLGERRMAVNSGLGLLIFTMIDILIISFSNRIITIFPNVKMYYMIYYIGALLAKVFGTDMLLSRVAYDLVSLRFVMLAFLLLLLHSQKNALFSLIRLGVISIFILVWLFDIYNGSSGCAPYQFL